MTAAADIIARTHAHELDVYARSPVAFVRGAGCRLWDADGKEVMRIDKLHAPSDADRLPNGHTLIAENNMVREFDEKGRRVWDVQMTWAVEVNRY